ncbi:MAG: hypothetical protein CM15mP78_09690 [Candidatus Poseidoniales archaeon]|nr:MAG: hypothetical protein CM15mP78_09690 [Candidatus Poseidoniales archaeon]
MPFNGIKILSIPAKDDEPPSSTAWGPFTSSLATLSSARHPKFRSSVKSCKI